MEDHDLIDAILHGDRYGFEQLIKKYQSNVFRTAIGFAHVKEDAEEITQDVFIKVYHSLPSFSRRASFSTWIYRITVNASINYLQSKKRKNFWEGLSSFIPLTAKDPSAETLLIEKDEGLAIRMAIDGLPEKQRTAFILSKYEELPQRQVAEIMRISEGAVEQLVLRAKNNLRKKLQPAIGMQAGVLSK